MDIEAALCLCAGVAPCCTLINILTGSSVEGQRVACRGTGAVEAAGSVGTAVGAYMSSSRESTLVNIFTSDPINVTELVATAAVALVRSVHIRAFLAARIGFTFIHIIAVPAIVRQFKAFGAAARVGTICVFTLVSTQASRVMSTLIYIFTELGDAVEYEAGFALTAVGAQ